LKSELHCGFPFRKRFKFVPSETPVVEGISITILSLFGHLLHNIMGKFKSNLKKLLAAKITCLPKVKYSFRLDRILTMGEENSKHKQEQRESERKQTIRQNNSITLPEEEETTPPSESGVQNQHVLSTSQPASDLASTTMLSNKKILHRISSEQAASIVKAAPDDLLIITTDASAGYHLTGTSGSAAILRLCRGKSSRDHVKAVVKYFPWADASHAEIAAVALACDAAVEEGISVGVRVLFIMDTQLDFYDPTRKANKLESNLESADDYKESMDRLIQVASCVMINKVKSFHGNPKKGGFLDHMAADVLASEACKNEEWSNAFHFDWIHNVPRLDEDDISLEWLRSCGLLRPTAGAMDGRRKLSHRALSRRFLNQSQISRVKQVQKAALVAITAPGPGTKDVMRISSMYAASIIEQTHKDLLVITVDASSNKSIKACGYAAILRLCRAKSGSDHVKVLVNHTPGGKECISKIISVAKACDIAVQEGIAVGRRVLILMQSQLNFYDSASYSPIEGRRSEFIKKCKESMALLTQVSSSVMVAKVETYNHECAGGFFDHTAASVLSKKALEDEEWASSFKHDWVCDVPSLVGDSVSMEWLRTSEDIIPNVADATGRPELSHSDRVQFLLDITL
jgi:hypothetical protein